MTNTIQQYVPGHYSSTERHHQLPALFSSRWFNSLFEETFPEKIVEDQGNFYPYNISVVKDGEEVTKYIVEVALAGVGKNNISVDVKHDVLTIQINKENETTDDTRTFLKHGISRRKSTFSYKLDTNQVEAKKIQSTYIDGLLTVIVPVKKKETHKIDIKVNID